MTSLQLEETQNLMSTVKISVIVPIYNMEQRLDRCLKSLQGITLTEIEFLLINDGSTDGSEEICKKFESEDARFVYRYKENGGVSSARNLGFSMAKGTYISYVDSDDYIDPIAWSEAYAIAEKKDVDVFNFGYHYVKGDTHDKRSSMVPKDTILGHNDILDLLSSDANSSSYLWFPWLNFFKKSLIDSHKISFIEDIGSGMEDTIFILDCYCKANTLYAIELPCYYYVYHSESLTQRNYKPALLDHVNRQYDERLNIYKEHDIIKKPYLLHLARHYMEHTFFAGLKNEKNNIQGDFLKGLEKMRSTPVYDQSLTYYQPSQDCTFKMKLLIAFFRLRWFRLVKAVY